MVHVSAVVRCRRPAIDAGNAGSIPATSAAVATRSDVSDARCAHSGRGRIGRLHVADEDSDADRRIHGHGDSDDGGRGYGYNSRKYQRIELGLAKLNAGGSRARRRSVPAKNATDQDVNLLPARGELRSYLLTTEQDRAAKWQECEKRAKHYLLEENIRMAERGGFHSALFDRERPLTPVDMPFVFNAAF